MNISDFINFIDGKSFESIKNQKHAYFSVKEMGNLFMVTSGTETDENESCETGTSADTNLSYCNSLIFEKESNRLVCADSKRIIDYTLMSELEENEFKNGESDVQLEYCEDGTIIRLYNYNDTWYTSTAKCIDGRISYWSGFKSFDEMFWETLDRSFLKHFDKDYTYVYVLRHVDNRIVVKHTCNSLVFISKVKNEVVNNHLEVMDSISELEMCTEVRFPNIYVSKPLEAVNMAYTQEVYDNTKRGILLKRNGRIYKNDFIQFTVMKDIRGNVPSIRWRYIELLNNQTMLENLITNYPEHYFVFEFVAKSLEKLTMSIFKLYVQTHVKRQFVIEEEHLFHQTLRQLHGFYKKTNTVITPDIIREKLCTYDKIVLKKLLQWVN